MTDASAPKPTSYSTTAYRDPSASLGNPATLEGLFQLLPHRLALRAAVGRQGNQVAAVIIEHRQRPHRLWPPFWSLEVHLPQFVGLAAFKALPSWRAPILLAHQIVAEQNAVNGIARQGHSCARQQHLQFARAPVRIAQSHLHYLLFQLAGRSAWAVMWLATLFRDPLYAQLLVALQPQVSRRTRDLIGGTQRAEGLRFLRGRHHKPDALLLNIHRLPCHRSCHPRACCARAGV